jgi:hypothetical protein
MNEGMSGKWVFWKLMSCNMAGKLVMNDDVGYG